MRRDETESPNNGMPGVSGTIGLVLRDSDGSYTVIDFKTDRVESEDELRSRAEVYS